MGTTIQPCCGYFYFFFFSLLTSASTRPPTRITAARVIPIHMLKLKGQTTHPA